jgi:predicted negative regulator of RcsB-dependent stress response
MATQSLAPRHHRPSDTEDVVLARLLQFGEWARRNSAAVITGAVLVLVAAAVVVYYFAVYKPGQRERAAEEFVRIQQTVSSGNAQLAERELATFSKTYEGTSYGDEASIALAQIQLQGGKPADAVKTLSSFTGRIASSPVGVQGAMLLASAQQQAGQADAAVQTYLAVADKARLDYQKHDALSAAAAIREEKGDFKGAAELYQRIVSSTEEGSMERAVFEMRAAEAEARAAGK